ncbi:hypothetical protein [Campylobacter troglodytis]|uniref:DUF7843 domain-containing protein n=1 Tax=Campylobacter troglodytis TaxID=654363 RepID=UPI00163BF286|nr:hypothetical protein [Campylobacter troglodytis]
MPKRLLCFCLIFGNLLFASSQILDINSSTSLNLALKNSQNSPNFDKSLNSTSPLNLNSKENSQFLISNLKSTKNSNALNVAQNSDRLENDLNSKNSQNLTSNLNSTKNSQSFVSGLNSTKNSQNFASNLNFTQSDLNALKQRLLSAEIYESAEFKTLLHYEKNKSSINKKSNFFLSKDGYKDPKAEYIATIEKFFAELQNDVVEKKQKSHAKFTKPSYKFTRF